MLSIINSSAILGIDAHGITIEVDITPGLPGFNLVGLPDSAIKESRERVFSALKNSGFAIPSKRVTVNLAPADVKKEGSAFDLPIALGILIASGQIDPLPIEEFILLGELSLDGSLRPARGILSVALFAKESRKAGLLVPASNLKEASLVSGLNIYPVESLLQVLEVLKNPGRMAARKEVDETPAIGHDVDFREVKGQGQAKRALEVAAAGAHHFLMVGSPGCGKSLMARRMPSILPLMTEQETLETTRIYSVAGLIRQGAGIIRRRPFRSPHHTISNYALIGGGAHPKPGEVSLTHNGILFLDELPEFHKNVLECLRQPLEDGVVTISRAAISLTYPCRFVLGAAMNPCPCGYSMDSRRQCVCRPEEISRYMARISGPLLDRIDIHMEIPNLAFEEMSGRELGETSAIIRNRVERAREIQRKRFESNSGISCNSQMSGKELRQHCELDSNSNALMRNTVDTLGLSARAYDRILKVSRTIADLEGVDSIRQDHVAEAIHYRCLDRKPEWVR